MQGGTGSEAPLQETATAVLEDQERKHPHNRDPLKT